MGWDNSANTHPHKETKNEKPTNSKSFLCPEPLSGKKSV
jgi:hypothetical protein